MSTERKGFVVVTGQATTLPVGTSSVEILVNGTHDLNLSAQATTSLAQLLGGYQYTYDHEPFSSGTIFTEIVTIDDTTDHLVTVEWVKPCECTTSNRIATTCPPTPLSGTPCC